MAVRWYLRYSLSLSYRDIVELLEERGVPVAHTTIMRWVHQYGPELDKRVRRFLKPTTDSYRVDETYIKVKGQWRYLYSAVDSQGQTIDFILSENRDMSAAKRFLKKRYPLRTTNHHVLSPWTKILRIRQHYSN